MTQGICKPKAYNLLNKQFNKQALVHNQRKGNMENEQVGNRIQNVNDCMLIALGHKK